MRQKLIVKYISIIFIITIFIGSMHHHKDLQEHSECQICIVQHNIKDIDTPVDIIYLTIFTVISEATISSLKKLLVQKTYLCYSARAPPLFT